MLCCFFFGLLFVPNLGFCRFGPGVFFPHLCQPMAKLMVRVFGGAQGKHDKAIVCTLLLEIGLWLLTRDFCPGGFVFGKKTILEVCFWGCRGVWLKGCLNFGSEVRTFFLC